MKNFEQYLGWTPAPWGSQEENCWTFVGYVMRHEFDVVIPMYRNGEAEAAIRQAKENQNWRQVESPQLGDIALLRSPNGIAHVGIMVSADQMLHYGNPKIGATIESISSFIWKGRVLGYYRHTLR